MTGIKIVSVAVQTIFGQMSCFICSHELDHNKVATANLFDKTDPTDFA